MLKTSLWLSKSILAAVAVVSFSLSACQKTELEDLSSRDVKPRYKQGQCSCPDGTVHATCTVSGNGFACPVQNPGPSCCSIRP
jgi:hypothetical protein